MVVKGVPHDDSKEEKKEGPPEVLPVQVVIQLLQTQNKMIATLSQTITKQLNLITQDVEMCKVRLSRLVKFGPSETKPDAPTKPQRAGSTIPESVSTPPPIG